MAKKKKEDILETELDEQEEKKGGGFFSILFVILIILVWLAIFAALIKFDVGGFGSGVLRPILKDVPVINRILPAYTDEEFFEEHNTKYSTLENATARIKELELKLADYQNQDESDSDTIKDLKAEVERLQVYEEEYKKFQDRVKEFDKKVVFAEQAPSIEEYKQYYEEIQPENAAEIYRQVVEQLQYDEKIKEEAKRYAKMDPASAAKVLEIMCADDLDTVCGIISSMGNKQASAIMNALDPATAAKVTKRMTTLDE
ncbi:MAG TPA: hypothetical protein DCW90_09220 [Lachnospiraceae bacterium]|nr:hypothetical protein [Lachnospiraceae bacterium]